MLIHNSYFQQIANILQFLFVYFFAFIFNIPRYNYITTIDNISFYLGDIYSDKQFIEFERDKNLKLIVNCTHDLKNDNNVIKEVPIYRIPISDIYIKNSSIFLLENIENIKNDIINYIYPNSNNNVSSKTISDLVNVTSSIKNNMLIKNRDIKEIINEKSILFHCRNGCQRSALCMALFISINYNIDLDNIINIIKTNRNMSFKPFLFKNCVNEFKKKYNIKHNDKEKY